MKYNLSKEAGNNFDNLWGKSSDASKQRDTWEQKERTVVAELSQMI